MYLMLSSRNDVVYGSQSLPSIQRAYWPNIAEQLKALVKVLSLMNISYQKAIKSLPLFSLSLGQCDYNNELIYQNRPVLA